MTFVTKDQSKYLHTIIRPILMYGFEMWILNKNEQQNIFVFQNNLSKQIFSPTLQNVEW